MRLAVKRQTTAIERYSNDNPYTGGVDDEPVFRFSTESSIYSATINHIPTAPTAPQLFSECRTKNDRRKYSNAIQVLYLVIFIFLSLTESDAKLTDSNKKLLWMVGKWRSEFNGKVVWPTVPTMTYGEELVIAEAPMAKTTKAQFFNFSARAWSHSTKDHFHDEWGFLTVDASGNATLMTTGNNGFTTYEVGTVQKSKLVLTLKDIGRISFSRDLPVEDLRRTFIKHDDTYMEQILEMRTATHPKRGYLEHTRVIYAKQADDSLGDL